MDTAQQENTNTSILPMTIIGLLFFIFGFVTWLNGSLMPFLKIICGLNDFQTFFVTFAFYIAYFVMAFPMALVLKKTGYRNGMALGLAIMAVGSLLFIPAAFSAEYWVFLIALFVLATGLTILQTASNPYVVFVGPKESAAMRISIMGIINKAAGVVVPIVFAAIILSGLDSSPEALAKLTEAEIQELSERLVMPYIYMAVALFFLIGLVKFTNLPEIQTEEDEGGEEKGNILQFPQVILGTVALFCYVGVEVIAGDSIGVFGSNLNVPHFASLTSYTMVFMVLGYILGVVGIPRFFSQTQALVGSGIAGCACIVGILLSDPTSSGLSEILFGWTGIATIPNPVLFVALMGMAHALVWPAVWPLALEGLGKYTAQGSALLIMGIVGGAIVPMAFGSIAEGGGDMQSAYLLCLPLYLYILYYALRGHKKRTW
ncbi:glucose/galactose MFS transporter [Temperatibacter marinus]|uniref:Glucose/galactose MFS transporter n=1 Tax=Temperatibacter marinus TaxID=1456591 RepID=A0AA52EK95_9PROT|nr:glucose/galactose MFS transporter [Temperatibacter marinus]WND04077.1 glucose/galactose MFS transporter [Temperatibacter marinus]